MIVFIFKIIFLNPILHELSIITYIKIKFQPKSIFLQTGGQTDVQTIRIIHSFAAKQCLSNEKQEIIKRYIIISQVKP